jgi:hypothetical protein
MKNTYLIYKDPKAEKKELIVATPKQWDEIMKANRGATQEERRTLPVIVLRIAEKLDRLYIEVEKPEFDKWHSQNVCAKEIENWVSSMPCINISGDTGRIWFMRILLLIPHAI